MKSKSREKARKSYGIKVNPTKLRVEATSFKANKNADSAIVFNKKNELKRNGKAIPPNTKNEEKQKIAAELIGSQECTDSKNRNQGLVSMIIEGKKSIIYLSALVLVLLLALIFFA